MREFGCYSSDFMDLKWSWLLNENERNNSKATIYELFVFKFLLNIFFVYLFLAYFVETNATKYFIV